MRLRQFLNSQLLEIKPSLGDGHCLLYSVCASFNNQLTYLDSINKSSLITTITDEVHGNTDAYLVFYTKSRSEFFVEFNNYIKYKRYNSDIGDVIPSVIANCLNVVINILNEDHNGNYELRDVHPLETAGTALSTFTERVTITMELYIGAHVSYTLAHRMNYHLLAKNHLLW